MFFHSLLDSTQSQGLQGNHQIITPFWNNYSTFSPQPYTKSHPESRRPSISPLSPQLIAVPPPSPSSSSVATPDEASPSFNFQVPSGPSPTPSITVSDVMKANSTLITRMRASVAVNGDTSCDEFSTTRSDVTRDEFLSPPSDVHYAEFFQVPVHSPAYLTPVPYVQRGFGYRDKRARGRGDKRRRTRGKPAPNPRSHQPRENSGLFPPTDSQVAPRKASATSDSDGVAVKPQQETWRVIGGGVMLGTPTSATSRRKLKRLQSTARAVEEDQYDESYDETPSSNLSTDESREFSDLVASVKLSINRPPLADIIERPKSSLPATRASPLSAFFTHAEVA